MQGGSANRTRARERGGALLDRAAKQSCVGGGWGGGRGKEGHLGGDVALKYLELRLRTSLSEGTWSIWMVVLRALNWF